MKQLRASTSPIGPFLIAAAGSAGTAAAVPAGEADAVAVVDGDVADAAAPVEELEEVFCCSRAVRESHSMMCESRRPFLPCGSSVPSLSNHTTTTEIGVDWWRELHRTRRQQTGHSRSTP